MMNARPATLQVRRRYYAPGKRHGGPFFYPHHLPTREIIRKFHGSLIEKSPRMHSSLENIAIDGRVSGNSADTEGYHVSGSGALIYINSGELTIEKGRCLW